MVLFQNQPFWTHHKFLFYAHSLRGLSKSFRMHFLALKSITLNSSYRLSENVVSCQQNCLVSKIYTFTDGFFLLQKKSSATGKPTSSAHPGSAWVCVVCMVCTWVVHVCMPVCTIVSLPLSARFSPDDKYSRQRIILKKRFGLLITQKAPQTE